MSSIQFGTKINISTVTPPTSGYIVAYDLDGKLKQKDYLGVITTIGSGGGGSDVNLSSILLNGNSTGTSSILLGTGTKISSVNNNNYIIFDYSVGNNRAIIMSTTNSSLVLSDLVSAINSGGSLNFNANAGLISISNGEGLKYTSDYSSSFVPNSLVSKAYVDSVSGGSSESIVIPNTVFVDIVNGNDSTAIIGRPDKPFSDVNAAIDLLLSGSGGTVIIRSGTYFDTVILKSGVNIMCEDGVNFFAGGFTDNSSDVECSVYGKANFFSGSSPLNVQGSSYIHFEFKKSSTTNRSFFVNMGTVFIYGDSIECSSYSGYNMSFRGTANVTMVIKEKIQANYNCIVIRSNFVGVVNVTCPLIETLGDGLVGPDGSLSHCVYLTDSSDNGGTIIINGNLFLSSTVQGGSIGSVVCLQGGIGTFSHIGNSTAYSYPNLLVGSDFHDSSVILNGNYINDFHNINFSGPANLVLNDCNIKTSATFSIYASPGAVYTIASNRSQFISTTSSFSSIFSMEEIPLKFNMYNSLVYCANTASVLIESISGFTAGFHNVRSNVDYGLGLSQSFTPTGYIYDTGFYYEARIDKII